MLIYFFCIKISNRCFPLSLYIIWHCGITERIHITTVIIVTMIINVISIIMYILIFFTIIISSHYNILQIRNTVLSIKSSYKHKGKSKGNASDNVISICRNVGDKKKKWTKMLFSASTWSYRELRAGEEPRTGQGADQDAEHAEIQQPPEPHTHSTAARWVDSSWGIKKEKKIYNIVCNKALLNRKSRGLNNLFD